MVGSCPCQDCVERNATCHSNCGKYINWREEYRKEMELAKQRSLRHSAGYYKKLGE